MAEKHVTLLANSSSGDYYDVDFYLEENKLTAFCRCKAGENRILCKHVKKIIDGDKSILYDSDQNEELEAIRNHLAETPIPLLLSEIEKAEAMLEEAKKDIKKAKKNLEIVLLGRAR